MNPLAKARDGATSAWRKSRDGTARTASWVKDGVGGGVGRARSGVSGLRGGSDEGDSSGPGPVRDGIANGWERIGGASLVHRGRADSRVGAALIIAAILLVLWIAWTIYVWTENGSTAGIGVLISWPAVLTALALVAAPFVAAVILVRRMAANGGPTLAVAGGGTAEMKAEQAEDEADESDEDSEDEKDEKSDDEGEEPDDSGSDDPDKKDEEAA